jgi:teichuronic acid biosynthesis glycosyltransferase TuaG
MKNNYKIDIILPVYNSKNFILDTLRSVINQTYKNWRLLIVDDNSTDGTRKLINDFINKNINKKKFVLIKNKKNKGQAFSRNLALKHCNSEYIAFIDSDDLWEENKLKIQIKYISDNGYSFTYSDYKSIKKDKIRKIITPNFFNYKSFINNTSIATSTMIVKKKILNGVFFQRLRLCEDYYLKCQLLKLNNAYKCPRIYSFYRLRNNSLQSNRLKVLLAVWNINKNLNNMNFINNFLSVFFITFNSLKKYAFR